jgi:dihydrofolate reductase
MISIIAAVAQNGIIGQNGRIPWDIPADRRRFRELTLGHTLLMGRMTFESIGAALPTRRCIVLSRRPGFQATGCEVVPCIADALNLCDAADELFVAGGEEIYRHLLPLADRLYISHICLTPDGDALFPEIPEGEFVAVSNEILSIDPPCTLVIYERRVAGSGA